MYYLIDGYNLIFSSMEEKGSLQSARGELISWVQIQFKKIGLQGIVVFDGSFRVDEEGSYSHSSPLEIAYTPKKQNADNFIIEKVEGLKNPKESVVVTNDKGLQTHCRCLGSKTMGTEDFLIWVRKKARQKSIISKEIVLSQREIDFMVKFFEERLLRENDE